MYYLQYLELDIKDCQINAGMPCHWMDPASHDISWNIGPYLIQSISCHLICQIMQISFTAHDMSTSSLCI